MDTSKNADTHLWFFVALFNELIILKERCFLTRQFFLIVPLSVRHFISKHYEKWISINNIAMDVGIVKVTSKVHFQKLPEEMIKEFPSTPPPEDSVEYQCCPICGLKVPKDKLQSHIAECCSDDDSDFDI